jgi:transcriptional regulator with XRE-family HTH domain
MSQGPATSRRRLGAELKRFRDEAGLTLEQAAEALECSTSKISRLENGKGLPKQRDVRDLARLYGKQAEERLESLFHLVRQGARTGWWQPYTAMLTSEPFVFDGVDRYVALESDASWLNGYDVLAVHGLAQTPDYARAVLEQMLPQHPSEELDELVEFRLRRQEVVTRAADPLRLSLILDENVFARFVGTAEIMAGQCRHLLQLCERDNVDLRVLPFSGGFSRVSGSGQFLILGFDESADQDVVFVEGAATTAYLAGDFGVETFKRMFTDALDDAMGGAETCRWLEARLRDLDPR